MTDDQITSWTITIDDPAHVTLAVGAQIKIGNNDQLRGAGLEPLPGVWQIVRIYDSEPGKQRYDVELIGMNRHQLRAALKKSET